MCQRLVETVLSDSLVSREVATPAASVRELIPPILRQRSHWQPTLHRVRSVSVPTKPPLTVQLTHHFVLKAPGQHQRIGAIVAPPVDPAHMGPVHARFAHLKGNK